MPNGTAPGGANSSNLYLLRLKKSAGFSSWGCDVVVNISTVLSQNITLLYDSLDLEAIDSDGLKRLMGSQAKPMVMDTPGVIVAVYPAESLVIQVGDRRTRITLQQHSDDIGSVPLWKIALKCDQLVTKTPVTLNAYGFNYDVGVELSGKDANQAILDLFIPDPGMVEGALGGYLLSFVPRLRFQRTKLAMI